MAYEYFQNDALDARNYFNSGPKARVRFNNFGGSFSGPMPKLKDKMFFYFDYAQIINPNQSTQVTTVPTDAMKAGYFDPASLRRHQRSTHRVAVSRQPDSSRPL